MEQSTTKSTLEKLDINLDVIADEKIREAILLLYNLVEDLYGTNRKLQEEIQKLRDENNRLKGEQGKPDIKPNKNNGKNNRDISSEKERKESVKRSRGTKKEKIKIDRQEICKVDKEILPEDAEFKGHESVIVQDLKIETDNIEFKKEVYYSPSENKNYTGQLPPEYEGEFGPNVKALTIIMKYVNDMTEPKIKAFFKNFNIHISAGTISNILTKKIERFEQEKKEIYKAGLESTQYQQIDDTGARVNGNNYHTHVMCNEFYTAYFTTKRKDRLTIIDILRDFGERKYCFNEEAIKLLERLRVSKKIIERIREIQGDKELTEKELEKLLEEKLEWIGKIQRARILEAGAIASYHKGIGHPVVEVLICDDAPQFKLVSDELGLCWIHEGRHYKKLNPVLPDNVKKLEGFQEKFWQYYKKLKKYKDEPTEGASKELSKEFDKLFSTKTRYDVLDKRIAKTKAKKQELLTVLDYPDIPLHNNEAELGARAQVRKRDISLQTKTDEGTKANDIFQTIVQTSKKLEVSAYEYIVDRIGKKFKLPSLADIIKSKSQGEEIEFWNSS